jgi:hypothetical protein
VIGSSWTSLLIAAVVVAIGAAALSLRGGRGGQAGPTAGRRRAGPPVRVDLVGGAQVQRAIGELPPGFSAAWSVPTAAGEIPAVIVGPTGLWAVAGTKARGNIGVIDSNVTISGHSTELASELWRRAHLIADRLALALGGDVPPVQVALVFLSGEARLQKSEAMGVRLLSPENVHSTIVSSRERLDAAAVEELSGALDRVAQAAG